MSSSLYYARMAEAHWREHCPRLVQELEASGALEAALQEANDQTVAEMADLMRKFLGQGLTPDQAERQAWELVRENHVLLPPEETLYPDADIRAEPFEKASLGANSFDLAISNVPFGDYAPYDPKLNPRKFNIHDYFFVAAAERVRPGGLVAFITSRYTLDKQYPQAREKLAQSCNLVAAIRLPHTAFKKNANTEVTTDIIILQKRAPKEDASGPAWTESKPLPGFPGDPFFLSEYYHAHPERMLGRLERAEYGMYGRDEVRLAPDDRELTAALAETIATLPEGTCRALTIAEEKAQARKIPVPPGVKPNAYVLTEEGGGGIAQRDGDELSLLTDLAPLTARRIRRLIYVRDAARDCLRTQVEDRPDAEWERARFRLNQDYDYFVGQFGPISDPANARAFAGDPDLPLLLSLEIYNEADKTAAKTAIFRERTVQRRQEIKTAGSAHEALVVTLNEKGRVDLEHIGKLLGRAPNDFLPELRGAIFLNPISLRWETDDEYLSGDVRQKLVIAERKAAEDPQYRLNAAALQAVQPSTADHANSKVNLAVKEIFGIWSETTAQRLTQLVFCDLSTPQAEGGDFSVYNDVRAKLIRLGVPQDEIAFIHDFDTDAAKLALFKDVRAGKVRIALGSTAKMGAGTNVQRLLVAEHHLDAPWRPADIEQREGRICRQGNTNATVKIFRYVTEGSFDAYSWQLLETKAKFIAQVMTGGSTARKIEDLDSPALTYAEVKAIASGNPAVVEKAKVDAEVMRLSRLRAEHQESHATHRFRTQSLEETEKRLAAKVASIEADMAIAQDTQGDKFRIVLDGKTYTERNPAGAALIYQIEDHRNDHLLGRPGPAKLAEFAGFALQFNSAYPDHLTLKGSSEYASNVSASPVGIISSLEHATRTLEDQAEKIRAELTQARKDVQDLAAMAGKVFEHEERYLALVKRQAELVDALDITKSQASSRLAAETEETETVATPITEISAETEIDGPAPSQEKSVTLAPVAPSAPSPSISAAKTTRPRPRIAA